MFGDKFCRSFGRLSSRYQAIESRDPDTLIPLATGDDGKPREMIFTPLPSEPSNFLLALWHKMCYIEDSS